MITWYLSDHKNNVLSWILSKTMVILFCFSLKRNHESKATSLFTKLKDTVAVATTSDS